MADRTFISYVNYPRGRREFLSWANAPDKASAINELKKPPHIKDNGKIHVQGVPPSAASISPTADVLVEECRLNAGYYNPRIARPYYPLNNALNMLGHGPLYLMAENRQGPMPHNPESLAASVNQLDILVSMLKDVFRSIEPNPSNFDSYGSLIRNILLLAAMEFENECRGILNANGYVGTSTRLNTNDYVKICGPLRLQDYGVALPFFPSLPKCYPFKDWRTQNPTQSLLWYDAYNATKHDRDSSFARATLKYAIDAVIACAIIITAQYRIVRSWRDQIGDFFSFVETPNWPMSEHYLLVSGSPMQPSNYAF